MQILGIRTASRCIRYAVVDWNGQVASLTNATNENRLVFPASDKEISQKIYWLHSELGRIYRIYPKISKVAIKMNEFFQEKMTTRYSTHMDGVAILSAMQRGKIVRNLLYANIKQGMSSNKVKDFAETNVGKSDTYWDNQMADAVAAALTVIEKDQ